jgi:hypothetical protein
MAAADVEKRIQAALNDPGRTGEGVHGIAKRFGVDPSTVHRISRPFAGCSLEAVDPVKRFGADKHERMRHVV